MSSSATTKPPAGPWLVPLSGPPLLPMRLQSKPDGILLGRHDRCDVRLPSDAVSRVHARLRLESGAWRLADLKSRWGTYLNGCRVAPDTEVPLESGDVLQISPWTFNFSSSEPRRRGMEPNDDLGQMQSIVRTVSAERPGALAEQLLALLLESAAALHAAENESALAEALIDAACRGSGLPNAALLRPIDSDGRLEVVASRQTAVGQPL